MHFNEVTIHRFPTGWNGIYPNTALDVESSLGAFTWRTRDSEIGVPTTSVVVTTINFDEDDDPLEQLTTRIIAVVGPHAERNVALDVAGQLLERIDNARNPRPVEPLADWEEDLLRSSDHTTHWKEAAES